MHYRNGREAKNGDKIVKLEQGKVVAFGVLHSAVPGNDYCNGNIATIQQPNDYACMVDCLHIDDVEEVLKASGLATRPEVIYTKQEGEEMKEINDFRPFNKEEIEI